MTTVESDRPASVERVRIDPDDLQVRNGWLHAPPDDEVLRLVDADVEAFLDEGDDPLTIGRIRAYVAWRGSGPDIAYYGDAEGGDEMVLGDAVAEIMEAHPRIRFALLIDRIVLEPAYRGNGLTDAIVDGLMGLLCLEDRTTAVTLIPVPLDDKGEKLLSGPERSAAMPKLQAAYRAAGFEPWSGDSEAWWRPVRPRSGRRRG